MIWLLRKTYFLRLYFVVFINKCFLPDSWGESLLLSLIKKLYYKVDKICKKTVWHCKSFNVNYEKTTHIKFLRIYKWNFCITLFHKQSNGSSVFKRYSLPFPFVSTLTFKHCESHFKNFHRWLCTNNITERNHLLFQAPNDKSIAIWGVDREFKKII